MLRGRRRTPALSTPQFAESTVPIFTTETLLNHVAPPLTDVVENSRPKHIAQLPILSWETVEELARPLAVFDHVFWEPDDTRSFRTLLQIQDRAKDKTVLEIGKETGLISLRCLQTSARKVVAKDINPWAVRN